MRSSRRPSQRRGAPRPPRRKLAADYRQVFTTLADLWDDATPNERRELRSKVIKRIEIEPGTWANPRKAHIVPRWSPNKPMARPAMCGPGHL